jgi:hypothetical protein
MLGKVKSSWENKFEARNKGEASRINSKPRISKSITDICIAFKSSPPPFSKGSLTKGKRGIDTLSTEMTYRIKF